MWIEHNPSRNCRVSTCASRIRHVRLYIHKTEHIDRRAGGGYILRQDAQFNKKVRASCTAVGVTAASFEVKRKTLRKSKSEKKKGALDLKSF